MIDEQRLPVCVIGAGTRFMSGISVYTYRLTNALARSHAVSTILMRQLLPTRLYPGRSRVGMPLSEFRYHSGVKVCDGVDWYWLPSMLKACFFLLRQRPRVVIFQWWTGTVLHSYLLLAVIARMLGARTIVEFHEVLDPGEAQIPLAKAYVGVLAPRLMHLADGFVVHSFVDRALLAQRYPLSERPVVVCPHGPYDHYQGGDTQQVYRAAPAGCCNLLYFGVIRPYKGLEDLIAAFDAIPPEEIEGYWLTIVGETWEGWSLPAERIAASRYRDRITFVNRYVPDQEVDAYFSGADAVVLPYHRSSASGPLHIAMSYGLPLVVTRVEALQEVVVDYAGAVTVPVQDSAALSAALKQMAALRGRHFSNPQSWERTSEIYAALFGTMLERNQRSVTA